ncbi:hypothetical protein EST38_g7397 [Candolleomyces aberdarensis]|uniref:Uncharacterized protein n=1 Tax=Candolleomyces aberdarensis TaxID=2316362 RepID=A0A4Q2DIJ0_9AGAR|nr:hypothetical protein EST38_g7397 [Candolleomyces aberdarensis]
MRASERERHSQSSHNAAGHPGRSAPNTHWAYFQLPKGLGNDCKTILGDTTVLAGGTVFTDEIGIKLKPTTPTC